LRIFWLLICLVLTARGGAAAALPIADARWHSHPVSEGGAVAVSTPYAGSQDETAIQTTSGRAAGDGPSHRLMPQAHHHGCHQLCTMLIGAVPAPMSIPASRDEPPPAVSPRDFSSIDSSPPVPPPRAV
jgi:hypothetical protein